MDITQHPKYGVLKKHRRTKSKTQQNYFQRKALIRNIKYHHTHVSNKRTYIVCDTQKIRALHILTNILCPIHEDNYNCMGISKNTCKYVIICTSRNLYATYELCNIDLPDGIKNIIAEYAYDYNYYGYMSSRLNKILQKYKCFMYTFDDTSKYISQILALNLIDLHYALGVKGLSRYFILQHWAYKKEYKTESDLSYSHCVKYHSITSKSSAIITALNNLDRSMSSHHVKNR